MKPKVKWRWQLGHNQKGFSRKSDLMDYITDNFDSCVNKTVMHQYETSYSSGTYREYHIWWNAYTYLRDGAKPRVELRLIPFRNKKYIFKPFGGSKSSKKHFNFSHKIYTLMTHISNSEQIDPRNAKNLINLFNKTGYKDFIPDEEGQVYIDNYLSDLAYRSDFSYFSDRCNLLRMRIVHEYFKRENLI